MLKLNLVSKELKKEIKLRLIYKMLKKANNTLIVITLMCAIVILVAKIILQNNFNKVVAQTTLITKNSQQKNQKVRDINSRISYIGEMQGDYIQWSYVFEELSKYSEDGIRFYSIKMSREDNIISIRGTAKERNDLIKLKEGFEESKVFTKVESPIKNILEKENIDFEIKASLDLSMLNNMEG